MNVTKANLDEQIVALLQQPNTFEKGFTLMVESYQEQLYWQIRRMVLDHEDCNDVLQNAFIRVYRGFHTFEGKAKLSTWLSRIAINEAITFLNSKKKNTMASIEEEGSLVAQQLKADSYFDGDDLQLQLQIAVAQLPEKQRIVFNLRYFEEKPYEEISEILDTSVGALKASFHHAVKKIESFFKNE